MPSKEKCGLGRRAMMLRWARWRHVGWCALFGGVGFLMLAYPVLETREDDLAVAVAAIAFWSWALLRSALVRGLAVDVGRGSLVYRGFWRTTRYPLLQIDRIAITPCFDPRSGASSVSILLRGQRLSKPLLCLGFCREENHEALVQMIETVCSQHGLAVGWEQPLARGRESARRAATAYEPSTASPRRVGTPSWSGHIQL